MAKSCVQKSLLALSKSIYKSSSCSLAAVCWCGLYSAIATPPYVCQQTKPLQWCFWWIWVGIMKLLSCKRVREDRWIHVSIWIFDGCINEMKWRWWWHFLDDSNFSFSGTLVFVNVAMHMYEKMTFRDPTNSQPKSIIPIAILFLMIVTSVILSLPCLKYAIDIKRLIILNRNYWCGSTTDLYKYAINTIDHSHMNKMATVIELPRRLWTITEICIPKNLHTLRYLY